MDMFGEFYDFKTQELVCPLCGSRDIEDCDGNDNEEPIDLFNFDKYIEIDDKTGTRKRIQR